MGDFQGHPFRGNQWTDPKGSSQGGTTVARGDWAAQERDNTAAQLAKDLRERSAEIEPKITALLQSFVVETGGHLQGLDHRLKTEESLQRKLKDEVKDDLTPENAEEAINDALRYTAIGSGSNYTAQYDTVMEKLAEAGYVPKRAINYWSDSPAIYQGTNITLMTPEGRKFELQFHTPESFAAKEKTHTHYEVYRTTDDPEVKVREWAIMIEMQSHVRRPDGWPPRDNRLRVPKSDAAAAA